MARVATLVTERGRTVRGSGSLLAFAILAFQTVPAPPAPGQGKLIVYGDMALFQPPGHPDNCVLRNRFKRGEPVGFRMFVADPATGKREESAQLVVHVNVSGRTVDIPDALSRDSRAARTRILGRQVGGARGHTGRDRPIHRDSHRQVRTNG